MAAAKQASARQQCTSAEGEGGYHLAESDLSFLFGNFDSIRERLLDTAAVLQTLTGLDEHCPLSAEELRRVARVMEGINDQTLAAATQGAEYCTRRRWPNGLPPAVSGVAS